MHRNPVEVQRGMLDICVWKLGALSVTWNSMCPWVQGIIATWDNICNCFRLMLPDPMVPNSHLSSAAQHDPPRAPSVTMPLCEPSLFLGSPRPQLTFALHRTSLAEGRVGGRVDGRHGGGGGYTGTVFEASGVESWSQEGKYLCVWIYVCVCVCVCVCE